MLWLLACVNLPVDTGASPLLNVISGDILFAGSGEPSTSFVLLSSAEDPPPPYGLGKPVNFSGVASSDYSDAGMPSADYSFPKVEDGSWVLTALSDGDHNFQPTSTAGANATCGDVVGGHIEGLEDTSLAQVTVEGGQWQKEIPVVLATTLTTQPPVFSFDETTIPQIEAASGFPVVLRSDQVRGETLDLPGPLDLSKPQSCQTFFPVEVVDADGDGVADPHPRLGQVPGAYDIWPHIYLRYLGAAEGESWASELLIPLDPLGGAAFPVNTPLPVMELTTLFLPIARHTFADGSSEVVQAPDLPAGEWALTVVSLTGQTWTVPNDSAGWKTTDESWDPSVQGRTITLQ